MKENERTLEVHGSPTRCPYCHDTCSPEDDAVICGSCLARHHRDCWEDRCGTCGAEAGLDASNKLGVNRARRLDRREQMIQAAITCAVVTPFVILLRSWWDYAAFMQGYVAVVPALVAFIQVWST